MLVEEGQRIISECGFKLKDENSRFASEEGYQKWLGQRHSTRVWGEFFSNAMVVAIRVILYFGLVEEHEEEAEM